MRILITLIIFIPVFLYGQNTFEYDDKEFQVGAVHITPPINYSSCIRLGNDTQDLVIDSIRKFLENNPYLSIEVGSHTDMRGSEKYNQKLSERRAQSIVNKLINLGIDSTRLTYKGYGESQPIIAEKIIKEKMTSNSNQEEIEKLHVINRRNEIKIIKIDN